MQNNETLQKMIELLKKYLNNTENLKEAESLLQQYQDAEKEGACRIRSEKRGRHS